MPTVIRIGPYRFFFYASDGDEPVHIHARRDDNLAKVLDPAGSYGREYRIPAKGVAGGRKVGRRKSTGNRKEME